MAKGDRLVDLRKIRGDAAPTRWDLKEDSQLQSLLNARVTLGRGTVTAIDPLLEKEFGYAGKDPWLFHWADAQSDNPVRTGVATHAQQLTNRFAFESDADGTWAVEVTAHGNSCSYELADGTDEDHPLHVWTAEDFLNGMLEPECCRRGPQPALMPVRKVLNWYGGLPEFGYLYDLFQFRSETNPLPFKNPPPEPSSVCIEYPICPEGMIVIDGGDGADRGR